MAMIIQPTQGTSDGRGGGKEPTRILGTGGLASRNLISMPATDAAIQSRCCKLSFAGTGNATFVCARSAATWLANLQKRILSS